MYVVKKWNIETASCVVLASAEVYYRLFIVDGHRTALAIYILYST